MRKKINTLLFVGIIGVLVSGTQFGADYGRAIWGDREKWWTPKQMALPLPETNIHFEMYVDDVLLQDLISRNSLTILSADGLSHPVAAEDIAVRLNNWQVIRASYLHAAVFTGFILGAFVMCLIIGMIQSKKSRIQASTNNHQMKD